MLGRNSNKLLQISTTVADEDYVLLVRDATLPLWDISREIYKNKSTEHFIGENDSVTTTWTDVYPSGTHDYPFPTTTTAIEVLSSDANDSGISTGILTLAANASDGDTITIGSRVYTLQSTLTNVDGNIHIDSTAAATILNIVDAIILGSGGEGVGTGYATAMTINISVSAADGTGDTIDFTSLTTYPLANDGDLEVLATTETGAQLSFGATAMVHPTGCQTIEIHGLSNTGEDIDELCVLNGTGVVVCDLTYRRVNNVHCQTVGTKQGSNFGNIVVRVVSGGDTLSQIKGFESTGAADYGHGESNGGQWTIPLNKIAYLTGLEVLVDSTKSADVVLYEAEGALRTSSPHLPRRILWQGFNISGNINHKFESYIKIKPLTDIWFRARMSASTGGVAVKLSWLEAKPLPSGT